MMSLINNEMSLRRPLIVILGATASGKTKLSLDLAQKFGGEIIGADSMQIYKGLDIISAKATTEERTIAKHHMIDELCSHETCTVLDYRNKALPIIDDLLSRNRLPIIVGGTNYYIESLLWNILIEPIGKQRLVNPGICANKDHELPSLELHDKLKVLDPDMAKRLHPNNKRKILRSLEVLAQKGRPLSGILKEQQSSDGGNSLGGGLRYPNTVLFWLKWDMSILEDRINKRVNLMMDQGLLDELNLFHKYFNEQRIKHGEKPDYTRGIFQSIGFKEFHEYLMLDEIEKSSDNGKLLLDNGIQQLKIATRRYAKKQCRWFTNRFLGRHDREVPPVYSLTTEDLATWDADITKPAINIIESYINNLNCPYTPLPMIEVNSTPNSVDESHFCDNCQRVFVGKFQWQQHMQSGKHKRCVAKQKKMKERTSVTNIAENSV